MAEALRLDKFLWFARIAKTRALARQLAEQGRLRIGGRVVDRAHVPVRPGDVLSFALRGQVRVIRIEQLPVRRGPPAEARALYVELAEGGLHPVSETSEAAAADLEAAEPLTSEGGRD